MSQYRLRDTCAMEESRSSAVNDVQPTPTAGQWKRFQAHAQRYLSGAMLDRFNRLKFCRAKGEIMSVWLRNGENIVDAMQVWCTRSTEAQDRRLDKLYANEIRDVVGDAAGQRLCAVLKEKGMYTASNLLPDDEELFLFKVPRGLLSRCAS